MTTIVVTAAVIERDGTFLVTRRVQGTHLEGYWEFPGGKCEGHESLTDCLRRELVEELGVASEVGPEIFSVTHDYDDRSIELHFFSCALLGEPVACLGQEMRWVERGQLRALSFPPADADLITVLAETPTPADTRHV